MQADANEASERIKPTKIGRQVANQLEPIHQATNQQGNHPTKEKMTHTHTHKPFR